MWRTQNASIFILNACKMLDGKQNGSNLKAMNNLPLAKRAQILSMLCEGISMPVDQPGCRSAHITI
jgi:hypothetical protein